jgi:hypothetical protein
VDCLSRLILYEQGGIPRIIAVLAQFSHDLMPMFLCGVMVWKVRSVRIVMRVVGRADHKMEQRHYLLPFSHDWKTSNNQQSSSVVGSEIAHQARGTTDCGEHRQAAGVGAQALVAAKFSPALQQPSSSDKPIAVPNRW